MNQLTEITIANARKHLLNIWHGLERKFEVGLTLHDHSGIFILFDGTRLLPDVNIHRFPCCTYREKKRLKCLAHCRTEAMKQARAIGGPFKLCCWRGIAELVMPLYQGNQHAATIFAGAFQDPEFNTDHFSQRYLRLYRAMPTWSEEKAHELEILLQAAGYSLMQIAANIKEKYHTIPGKKGEIYRFLQNHFAEPVSIEDLAAELEYSTSHTGHQLHALFGKSFSEMISEIRISSAARLLQENELPLREIASMTGFQNEFYFSRVFKKYKGVPPGIFRKMAHSANSSDDFFPGYQ